MGVFWLILSTTEIILFCRMYIYIYIYIYIYTYIYSNVEHQRTLLNDALVNNVQGSVYSLGETELNIKTLIVNDIQAKA